MIKRNGIAALTMLLFGAISPSARCHAKPSDLPGDVTHQCPAARDGQQVEGFSQQPDAVNPLVPPPVRTRQQVQRDRGGSHSLMSLKVDRTPRSGEDAEEQDAPPTRTMYREPTERRGAIAQPAPRARERERRIDDDLRREEMLRSTEPLETQPQRPLDEDETLQEDDLEPGQYDEVPPAALTGPLSRPPHEQTPVLKRMPRADEDSRTDDEHPGSLLLGAGIQSSGDVCENHIINFPWGVWLSRSLCGVRVFDWSSPCVVNQYDRGIIVGGGIMDATQGSYEIRPSTCASETECTLEFKCNSIGLERTRIPPGILQVRDPNDDLGLFDRRLVNSFRGLAVTIPAHDCFGRGKFLLRAQPLLILVYPVVDEMRGFLDRDGALPPNPINDFPPEFAPSGPYFE